MDRLQQLMRGMPGGGVRPDAPIPDCSEKVHVSSLALLKMLKHGRAGVPMEVKLLSRKNLMLKDIASQIAK